MDFLETTFYYNPLRSWAIAISIAILVTVGLRIVREVIERRWAPLAERTKTPFDDALVALLRETKAFFLLLIGVYAGSLALSLPEETDRILATVVILGMLLQAAVWGTRLISLLVTRYAQERVEADASSATTISALGFVGRLALWTTILLLALDNLGVDVTALIAGVGLTGIAVALALQNILGDLFASLTIVLDKPFVVGDFIIVGDFLGTVEHIGIKTTRVRSLSGEQLIFANGDLLQSRIRNYKRMFERRVVFSVGVVYGTPSEKLQTIPQRIRAIIEQQEKARFDRCHFKAYGDFSLNFETVYWVEDPDYNFYMDVQQKINLAIYRAFEEEGIVFAYPTQTVHLVAADPQPRSGLEAGNHSEEGP